jgi:TfoX/Sxy family transcriptional regulator of competence genes
MAPRLKKWERASPELIARFDACVPKAAGVDRRQMFGCPCAFVNGNLFTGLHEQRLIVRLPEAQRAALLRTNGAQPFAVMGRTMREYVAIDNPLARAPRQIGAWMKKALAYAQALPPKTRRAGAETSRRSG